MAWDSSSSSDEPLQHRASRRSSGRAPRQIPRLLLADSSDEEVSPKILKRRDEGEKAQDAKNETGDSRDGSPKEPAVEKFAEPESVESNVAPADTSGRNECSESKSVRTEM